MTYFNYMSFLTKYKNIINSDQYVDHFINMKFSFFITSISIGLFTGPFIIFILSYISKSLL
jgi:hypothetical protein